MERVNFIILVLIVSQVVIPFVQEFYDGILHRHRRNKDDTFVDAVLTYANFVFDIIIINELIPYIYRYFEVR